MIELINGIAIAGKGPPSRSEAEASEDGRVPMMRVMDLRVWD